MATSNSGDGKPPRGVKRVKRTLAGGHEVFYYYHKASGTRLAGEPGTPEFQVALRAAQRGQRPLARPESFKDIADAFVRSPEWRRCVPRYRHDREILLKIAIDRFDWMSAADLGNRGIRDEIFTWRDELADMPNKADAAVSVMRRLLSWAYDRNKIEFNHALRIPPLAQTGTRRDKVWTPELERKLLASAPPCIRRLYLFALFTTVRESDIAAMDGAMFDGEWLVFQPSKTKRKTGVVVHLPVYELPALAELLADAPEEGPLLTSPRGHRWTASNIRYRFGEAVAAAGIKADLHFHDIRGTGISRMLEAGATDAEVASISGHSIGGGSKIGDYAARSRVLALNAYRKLARSLTEPPAQVFSLASGKRRKTAG